MVYIWEFTDGAVAVRKNKGKIYLCPTYTSFLKFLKDQYNHEIVDLYQKPEMFTRKSFKLMKDEL